MVEVRDAVPTDALAVARVHVAAWQVGYRGLLPDDYLTELRPEDRAARYRFDDTSNDSPTTIVALREDIICGFAAIGPSPNSSDPSVGELLALYVDPAHWRLGIGGELITEARRRLFNEGCRHAVLWVLVGNDRAAAFYRSDGWSADGTERQDQVWGLTVDEQRYQRALV